LVGTLAVVVATGPAHADATTPAAEAKAAAEGPTVALIQSIADGALAADQFFSPERGMLLINDYWDGEVNQPDRQARLDCDASSVRGYMREPVDYAQRFTCRPSEREWVCTGRILTDNGGPSVASLYFLRDASGRLLLDRMVHTDRLPLTAKNVAYVKKQLARRKPCAP
jgi:hypothetical protein